MSIKLKLEPFLEELRKANGRGNVNIANLNIIKMIELLAEHLDRRDAYHLLDEQYNPIEIKHDIYTSESSDTEIQEMPIPVPESDAEVEPTEQPKQVKPNPFRKPGRSKA